MRHVWVGLILSGCCVSTETLETLPMLQDDPAVEGPLAPGLTFEAKKRESLLARANHGFNEPAIGIVKGQCDDVTDGGPTDGSGCTTATLTCNETVIGHTVGGVNRYDSRFYERTFCTPYTTDHDSGDERIYRLDLPEGDWTASVTLDTPCAHLDLFGIRWDSESCPNSDHLINQCEASVGDWNRKSIRLVSNHKSTWYVVVEGQGDDEGTFALSTQCRKGLQ